MLTVHFLHKILLWFQLTRSFCFDIVCNGRYHYRINDPGINPDSPEQELEKLVGGSVSECDIISGNGDMIENSNTVGRIVAKESLEPGKNGRSTNATVEVHKTIITPSQTQDVSIVVIPEKNSGCCVIL